MKNRIIVLFCACALAMMCFTGCDKKDASKSDGQKEAQEAADSNTAEEEIISGSPADEKPVIEITDAGGGEKPAEEEPAVGMANPWVEITEREANEICLRLFKAPDGATEVKWLKCEKLGNPEQGIKPMVQLSFTLDDLNFTARAWQGAAEDADISGIYTDWTVGPEDVTLANWGDGNMVGKMYRAINDDGYLDLITWYDIEIGIKYSLSVEAKDLDGFDIQAVAEQMYKGNSEASGTSSDVSEEVEKSDGIYGSYLKTSDKDKVGKTDEYGLLYKVVYKSSLNGDTLNLVGTMDYRNTREQDPISVSDDLSHVFTINDKTVFQMNGGDNGPENVSMDEFTGYLKTCSDSGLYVEVEVKDGVAVTVSISA